MRKIIWRASIFVVLLSQSAITYGQGREFPQTQDPLISPPGEIKEFPEEKIDQENFEIAPFFGLYSVEGFDASVVYGAITAIHVSEDVFFEGNFGMTTADLEAFRIRTGLVLLTDKDVVYWSINLGYNLFPGQIFLSRKKTLNSTIYLSGGVGQTTFDNQNRFTFNIGTGYKVFFTDWLDAGFRIVMHSFETDLTGVKERTYNMEGRIHIAIFF
ncbi:MAG: outer membrane beta-barrel domain-containing protein [Nitrospiria bacterium]